MSDRSSQEPRFRLGHVNSQIRRDSDSEMMRSFYAYFLQTRPGKKASLKTKRRVRPKVKIVNMKNNKSAAVSSSGRDRGAGT